jgi:hypothetical protein
MSQDDDSSKVVFEGEEFQRPNILYQSSTPKIIQGVMKYSGGLVKDEAQAIYVIIGFAGIFIVCLFFIFGIGRNAAEIKAPPGMEVIYPENEPPRLQKKS